MIIGLDVGGTHTDVVLISSEGLINQVKVPTDPQDLYSSVLEGLNEILKGTKLDSIERIVLSTTLTTNAVVSGTLEPVGLIVSSGPGINPEYYRIGDHYFCVQGSIDHRGREVQPIEPMEIEAISSRLRTDGIKSVGVIGKFSVRNPSHENKIVKLLKNGFDYILAGHRISGNLNFPRRIATVYLYSAVYKIHRNFFNAVVDSLKSKGIKVPIHILKADGGTMSVEASLQFPGQTILSGPAASVMGAVPYANDSAESLVLDIGGTTTDMAILVKRVPLLEPLGIELGGFKTLIRALKTKSVPLGGDSLISITENKELVIGPKRVGPAMAFGGSEPTPTDALVFLGIMKAGDSEKARYAMDKIAEKLGISNVDAAQKVYSQFCQKLINTAFKMVDEINERPVYTVHEFLEGYKVKPSEILILGGPAPYFSEKISEISKLPVRVVPNWNVANALGAALARATSEITLFVDTERGIAAAPEEDFYKPVDKNFTMDDAKKLAFSILKEKVTREGGTPEEMEMEVLEEQQFNMVRGFYTTGKNIRIRVQVKPGLIKNYQEITSKL